MSCIVTLVRTAQVIWTMLGDRGTGEVGGPANKAVLPSDFLTRGLTVEEVTEVIFTITEVRNIVFRFTSHYVILFHVIY